MDDAWDRHNNLIWQHPFNWMKITERKKNKMLEKAREKNNIFFDFSYFVVFVQFNFCFFL